jgi:hypothetical protein
MTKRMLIECEICGTPYFFISTHKNIADVEADLDWAMKNVKQCYTCRPNYAAIKNRRMRFRQEAKHGDCD